jgi:hypothetical protein
MAIVRPTGGIVVPKTLVENGIYYAADDDADGYDPVTVAVPIGGKMITKNGVYHAADDDLRGYDPVNVSVPMYWTFPPGETVPPSMITPDTQIEEDAPPSSEDVPYPTQEDPQRVIKPKFRFVNNGRVLRESDGQYVASYGGILKDAITGEVLATPHGEHLWRDNEEFILDSWELSGRTLRVQFHYDWYSPGVTYWDTFDLAINLGDYTASSGSGQNTNTVYGG